MSQHELSEEQALEVAERAIVDAIGLSYERSMVIAVLAGYAAATGSVWQADTSFEYDRAIHHNPDAKAWADLFVATYPALADKHDVMLGWFANAMMAMHDHLASKQRAAANLAEAERDIARKAWDAAMELARNSDRVLNGFRVVEVGDLWVERDRYLAREYHAPAPEGVTLSDGSVVTRRLVGGAWSWVRERMPNARFRDVQCWPDLLTETDTGADFDALKAFAAKVGAA